jgi:predicted adenylyl cyclase CyaB
MAEMLRHNLELKVRCADLGVAAGRVQACGAHLAGSERQTDTYFHVPHGRLKLREIEAQPAVLIWYDRADQTSSKSSHYYLVPILDPAQLKTALTAALGVRGVVEKRREIWLYQNVRIHLDQVAGLGCFLEFEAVLGREAEMQAAQALLDRLGASLGIQAADCVAVSYADLLGLCNPP